MRAKGVADSTGVAETAAVEAPHVRASKVTTAKSSAEVSATKASTSEVAASAESSTAVKSASADSSSSPAVASREDLTDCAKYSEANQAQDCFRFHASKLQLEAQALPLRVWRIYC